jgi:hypothetical protein
LSYLTDVDYAVYWFSDCFFAPSMPFGSGNAVGNAVHDPMRRSIGTIAVRGEGRDLWADSIQAGYAPGDDRQTANVGSRSKLAERFSST